MRELSHLKFTMIGTKMAMTCPKLFESECVDVIFTVHRPLLAV